LKEFHHFFKDGKMIEADIYICYHKYPQNCSYLILILKMLKFLVHSFISL